MRIAAAAIRESALGNIQKVKDGPRLSGRMSASEEFVPITPAEREEADFV